MKKHTKIICMLLAICMLASLAACGGSGGTQAAEKAITVGTTNAGQDFEMAFGNNGIGYRLVYEYLFQFNADTGNLEPQLVDTYEWLNDTQLKLTLKDAKFSDGEAVTTEDVLFSLKYFIDQGSNQSTYFTNYDFDNFEIINEKTMVIHYFEASGPSLNYLTLAPIQNKSYYEQNGQDAFWDKPCGSGPYKVVENVSGAYTVYQLRDDYWGTKPEAEKITVRIYSEASTMYMDFENGAIDAAFDIDVTDAERAQNDSKANLVLQASPDCVMFVMPSFKAEFQDIRVREAIAIGVDWDKVGKAAYGAMCEAADSTLPNGVQYKISVGKYEYNPTRAKELLAEAGYADGFSIRLVVMNGQTGLAEAVQGYLKELNIDLNVETYELSVAVPMMMKGESEAMLKSSPGGASCMEPDQIYDLLKASSTNVCAAIPDEELDGYLMGGLYSVDEAERAAYYEKAQQWLYENMWAIPICYTMGAYVYNSRITLKTMSTTYPDLRYVHFN